jgi:multidrug efflux pump subunit AcrB
MWIVQLALRKPHTFFVMGIIIILFGVISILRMPIDIFPDIDIPIVSCIWTYQGMSPWEMENLVSMVTERALTSTINGIDHMESTSVNSMSIIKVYLHQGTPIGEAVSMVGSVGTAILRTLPRGIYPPFVTASSATDVPVLQLSIHSEKLNEAQLFDIANNFIRTQLATVQGTTTAFPYGGKVRQVVVDLDPQAMVATNLSASEVITAINNSNVIAPTGTAKIGPYEYIMDLNSIPATIKELNQIPVKTVNKAVVFVQDVAQVHDGYIPQLNIVNRNGKRSLLFNILRSGKASTLSVVQRVKEALPHIKSMIPPECKVDIITDESLFVKDCVSEVVREALIAAGLTAIMMLALLGSWRSTVIVATSIPLAILSSLIVLNILGQTINSMTLGGMALAVGMLVDDATVAIENLHQNLDMGKTITRAILHSAEQVALPALVSTLSICIVFVPLLFLTEPSKSLFVPLGMSVVFAMLASYVLSRTIVPLMSKLLLTTKENQGDPESEIDEINGRGNEKHQADESRQAEPGQRASEKQQTSASHETEERNTARRTDKSKPEKASPGFFYSIHLAIEHGFETVRNLYGGILGAFLARPGLTAACFAIFYAASLIILPFIGEDYFPSIDSGQLRLHLMAHAGTRIEETERVFKRVENAIRKEFPGEVTEVLDNIGLPPSGINFAYSDSQTVSEADGEILVTLNEHHKHPTDWYQKQMRRMLNRDFSECKYFFQPADIVTQILNAGLPAPIDVKIIGYSKAANYEIAKRIKHQILNIKGAADVTLKQVTDAPQIEWEVDRVRAGELGVTQQDVSESFNISLSSSFQTKSNYWLNRKNGVMYNLVAQTPQYRLSHMTDIQQMPINASNPGYAVGLGGIATVSHLKQPQMLLNLAKPTRLGTPQVVNHINVQPCFDIFISCQDRDLGNVGQEVRAILAHYITEAEAAKNKKGKSKSKDARDGKDSGDSKETKDSKDSKDSDDSKDAKKTKSSEEAKEAKEAKDTEDAKAAKVNEDGKQVLPSGTRIVVTGQYISMVQAYIALIGGLCFAMVLVYMLLVVNFQSWLDPWIILLALPGAFSGILWSLFVTQTTFSIPALMGTIMTVGVASANSILMVSFANDELRKQGDVLEAARTAGFQRFRPVVMTATAMIVGMIPMAIAAGAGGSQNAPIGRAVIGGLIVATFSTLLFVPTMFYLIHGKWEKAVRSRFNLPGPEKADKEREILEQAVREKADEEEAEREKSERELLG